MKRVTTYILFLHPEEQINVYLMYKCITFPTVTIKKIFLNPSEEKHVVHEGDSKLSFGMPGGKKSAALPPVIAEIFQSQLADHQTVISNLIK